MVAIFVLFTIFEQIKNILFIMKHVLTQGDLDKNPELAGQGLEVGDEIELPMQGFTSNEDGEPTDENGDPLPPKTPPVTPPFA